MKYLLSLLFFIFTISQSIAQELNESKLSNISNEPVIIDSVIEARLLEYKILFDKGLINENEYSQLKENLLLPLQTEIKKLQPQDYHSNKVNNIDISTYKDKSINYLSCGTLLLAGGLTLIGLGANQKINKVPKIENYIKGNTYNFSQLDYDLRAYEKKYIILFSLGGVVSGVGIILDAFGINNRFLYINNSKSISMKFANEGLGVAFCFK